METRYLRWNDSLTRHFFRAELSGSAVYLYVTSDTLVEVGGREDLDPDSFVEAVRGGPPWLTRQGLCQRALQAYAGWRTRGLDLPPYVAYLALFVLAAGHEGDFATHAYYPRLRQLLGEEPGGMLPSFDRMLDLWDDLERWSTRDKEGKLGLFEAKLVGGWIHVGLPLAQTILAEEERKGLPRIFLAAGLEPGSVPPDDEVLRSLRLHGRELLRPRTIRLLETGGDQDRLSALVDVAAEQLAEWDGRLEEGDLIANGDSTGFGAVRLCAIWDPVSRRLATSLRCKINGEFPDGRLRLVGAGLEEKVECREAVGGWSTEFVASTELRVLDGHTLAWDRGAVLNDSTRRWRFAFRGSPVRVLIRGTDEGLPGLIEVSQIPRSEAFWLLFQAELAEDVRRWAPEGCRRYKELAAADGLPEAWLLAQTDGLLTGGGFPKALSVVAPSARVRLRFTGGVRSGPGNNFFSFAPPSISIEGGTGDEVVWCDGADLGGRAKNRRLPRGLPVETRIVVEVRCDAEIVRRRSLYLTGDFAWNARIAGIESDRWGRPGLDSQGGSSVCGARVAGEVPVTHYSVHPLQAVAQADASRRRTFLVGRRVGQITRWPQDPYPDEWEPVWAIPMETRGEAYFCGFGPDQCGPLGGRCCDKSGRRWKEILWTWRHRIEPPDHPALQKLWGDYKEAARCA